MTGEKPMEQVPVTQADGPRVYIAARFSRRPECNQLGHVLKARGCTITSRWSKPECDHVLPTGLSRQAEDSERQRFAREDVEDVRAADWTISLMEEPRSNTRGGRHIEFGLALALGHRLTIIGPRETVFYHLPNVEHFDTVEAFVASLPARLSTPTRTEAQGDVAAIREAAARLAEEAAERDWIDNGAAQSGAAEGLAAAIRALSLPIPEASPLDEWMSVSVTRDGVVTSHNAFDADFDDMVRATQTIITELTKRLENRKYCPYSHGAALRTASPSVTTEPVREAIARTMHTAFMAGDVRKLTTTSLPGEWPNLTPSFAEEWRKIADAILRVLPATQMRKAAQAVVANAQRSYRSRGKDRYIEDDNGEAMMLVPHEDWHALTAALSEHSA
jgi:hypothetical protein